MHTDSGRTFYIPDSYCTFCCICKIFSAFHMLNKYIIFFFKCLHQWFFMAIFFQALNQLIKMRWITVVEGLMLSFTVVITRMSTLVTKNLSNWKQQASLNFSSDSTTSKPKNLSCIYRQVFQNLWLWNRIYYIYITFIIYAFMLKQGPCGVHHK